MPNNPPVDTQFFTVKGRISEVWRLWLYSITTAANAVAGALLAANNLSDLLNIATARQNLGLGSAATHNVTDFDAAGAASSAVAAIPTSSPTQTQNALITPADWSTFNGKQNALGYTPLNPANNLSEVTSRNTALANLGGVTSAQAAAAAPVQSVNGQTGAVSLSIPPAQVAANLASSSSTGVTGTLPIANGGTGQTTQQAAINALTGTQGAGKFLRSDGTNATLSAIQASDVPTLNQSTTGTAANVTGTVAIANGGTGQTTQQAAINALTGTQGTGKFLRSDGTNATLSAIQASDVPVLNQNTTGTAANVTGTVAIANGGTGATTAAAGLKNLVGAWASWAPTVSCTGSMTASSLSVVDGQYLVVGAVCHFKLKFTVTLGGTADFAVLVTTPVAGVGTMGATLINTNIGATASWGYLNSASNFAVQLLSGANFALGSYTVWLSGSYRVS